LLLIAFVQPAMTSPPVPTATQAAGPPRRDTGVAGLPASFGEAARHDRYEGRQRGRRVRFRDRRGGDVRGP
jgi:hypothetical protein